MKTTSNRNYSAVGAASVGIDGLKIRCDEEISSVNDEINEDQQIRDETELACPYRLYPQRHAILLSFSILTCVNSWMWITWSPVANSLASYWSVDSRDIDALSYVYMYIYIPLSFPALRLLNQRGLRFGLLCGAVLNFAGSLVRYGGIRSYLWVYTGTAIAAVAQTFTLAVPPLLAGTWFGANERGEATSLGVLANQFGTALGMGGTILMRLTLPKSDDGAVGEGGSGSNSAVEQIDDGALHRYVGIQMAISAVALVLVGWFVDRDIPPTPPSEAAEAIRTTIGSAGTADDFLEEDSTSMDLAHHGDGLNGTTEVNKFSIESRVASPMPGYATSIRTIVGTLSGISFVVIYGLVVGVFYAMATFLSQFVIGDDQLVTEGSSDWSEEEAGYLGLSMVLAGLLGSLASGYYMDRTHSYRGISIALLVGSLLAMTGFLLGIQFSLANRVLVFLFTSLAGLFLTGFIGAGFEYGTAISYPSDEAAVAGVLNVSAQVAGWALIYIGGTFPTVGLALNSLLVGMLFLSLLLFFCGVSAKSKRPAR